MGGRKLSRFTAPHRRFEYTGTVCGVKLYTDYGHNPAEMRSALENAVKQPHKRLFAVMQPHTYSRTRLLMEDFLAVLEKYPTVIYPTYAAREKYDYEGSAYALYAGLKERGAETAYAENAGRLFEKLEEKAGFYGEIYILGAGDLYDELTKRLKKYDKV